MYHCQHINKKNALVYIEMNVPQVSVSQHQDRVYT